MEHIGATVVGGSSSNPELSQYGQYDENYQVKYNAKCLLQNISMNKQIFLSLKIGYFTGTG